MTNVLLALSKAVFDFKVPLLPWLGGLHRRLHHSAGCAGPVMELKPRSTHWHPQGQGRHVLLNAPEKLTVARPRLRTMMINTDNQASHFNLLGTQRAGESMAPKSWAKHAGMDAHNYCQNALSSCLADLEKGSQHLHGAHFSIAVNGCRQL